MIMFRLIALVGLFSSTAVWAHHGEAHDGIALEDDEESTDDELDDLLGGSTTTGGGNTAENEKADFASGRTGDKVGARQEDILLVEDDGRKRRLIKTLQRKNFTKLGRFEASPHIAFVANDPFLNRYIVGSGINYNLTEVFAIEANLDFSPDLGDGDYKPLTKQLIEKNHVSPDISKLTYFGNLTFMFSPIYGKVAIVGRRIINFDIFGTFGMGMTRTSDDLQALDTESNDDRATVTQHQLHPTTNFGGGTRVIFSENVALRIEGRSMVYIETVNATTLEMKNNLIVQASMSFFFPAMKS